MAKILPQFSRNKLPKTLPFGYKNVDDHFPIAEASAAIFHSYFTNELLASLMKKVGRMKAAQLKAEYLLLGCVGLNKTADLTAASCMHVLLDYLSNQTRNSRIIIVFHSWILLDFAHLNNNSSPQMSLILLNKYLVQIKPIKCLNQVIEK